MKFLENGKLADLTAKLTDASVGVGDRFINGRIEAFTMKRAGTDKKYAHALGEKFQHELDLTLTEIAELRRSIGRSVSVGSKGELSKNAISTKRGKRRSLSMDESKTASPRKVKSCLTWRSESAGSKVVNCKKADSKTKGKGTNLNRDEPTAVSSRKLKSCLRSISEPSCSLPKSGSGCSRSQSEPLIVDVNKSPNFSYSNSALGDFQHTCTRRLMTDIILTLNTSFPDYDFSNVKPSHFEKVKWNNSIIHRTNEKLTGLEVHEGKTFLSDLWSAIDDVINISESDVYSYAPPNKFDDDDPLSFLMHTLDGTDGTNMVPLWTFNFFFINKSLKRILLFSCVQTVRNGIPMTSVDETDKIESFNYDEDYLPRAGGDWREEEDEYDDLEDLDINCMGQAVYPPSLPAGFA